jgi:tRNA threonylcarbamoyladenosine biosynthesis protein TsaB
MNLLAFDTSTDVMSIAVQRGDQVVTQTLAGGAQASATLIPSILSLLQQAQLNLRQLDAIVFGRGPGSFTGLRTACAVAQGLAFGAQVRVLPIDTLAAVAEAARQSLATAQSQPHNAPQVPPHHALQHPPSQNMPSTANLATICAALDARMGEMYLAYYQFNSYLRPVSLGCSLILPQDMPVHNGFAHTVLAGNVRPAYDAHLPAAVIAAPFVHCLPTADALLRLAPQMMADGKLVDAQDALPLYIRDKVAQTTAERAA